MAAEILTEKDYISYTRRMKKMWRLLHYLQMHLEEDLTAEKVATEFGYNKKYFELIFAEYFSMPFYKFFKKLRLRKAAEALVSNGSVKKEWNLYGFQSNISFSNGFKKEFGVSPREFLERGMTVPSMPERKELFGIPLQITYQKLKKTELLGIPMETEHGDQTDLLSEAAYALDHDSQNGQIDRLKQVAGWYGVWWYDFQRDNKLYYYVGAKKEQAEEILDRSSELVSIDADYYAVFSYDASESDMENARISRLLARYALKEWKLLTYKKPNNMGWTFEYFDGKQNHLYVPIIDMADSEGLLPYKGSGVDTWAKYIDRHIREKLTLTSLAEMAHYTAKSFRDIFTMYYAIEPMEYVRKRRLYEAAEEIALNKKSDLPKTLQRITSKYRFSSYDEFCEQFINEFGMEPGNYSSLHIETVDLNLYYLQNKEQFHSSIQILDDFRFCGKSIQSGCEEQNYIDVSVLASFWFRYSFEELSAINKLMPGDSSSKAAFWAEEVDKKTGETLYNYMLGPVIRDLPPDMSDFEQTLQEYNSEYQMFHLKGGRYMCFESMETSDDDRLTDVYRMLTRCAFFGWIRKNMYRYDGRRLTFVKYENEKLYFYVPIKG